MSGCSSALRGGPLLTPFGRDMLPTARQLVQAADVLLHEAEAAKRKPWRLAVPGICSTAGLARLVAEARGHGVTLDLRIAAPAQRRELLHAQQVRAALLAVPPDEATWSVPLGLAGAQDPGVKRVYLETLRVGRASSGPRPARVDPAGGRRAAHPRSADPAARRGRSAARPARRRARPDHRRGGSPRATHDLLLCSPAQAEELGLHWRPIGE